MHQKLQEIIEELNDVRLHLYHEAESLTQAQLDFKAAPDAWSIGEILSHLATVEKGLPKLYTVLLKKAEEAGFREDQTEGSFLHSLDHHQLDVVKEKVSAPERVLPQSGLAKADLLSGLRQTRQDLVAAVAQAGNYDLSEVKWPHPMLGEINFYQWVLFVGHHEKRHLSQIAGIKATPDFPQ